MPGETSKDLGEITSTIVDWLADLGRLLQCIERVIDHSRPSEDCPIEVKTLMPLLLPLIRQCRSQVPSAQMIEVWVRSVQMKMDLSSPDIEAAHLPADQVEAGDRVLPVRPAAC